MQVTATDRDVGVNAKLSYRLSPQTAHSDVFSIDADTGQIYIRSALDYERNARYHLTVMACDGAARNQLQDDGQRIKPGNGNVVDRNKVCAVNITGREFGFKFHKVLEFCINKSRLNGGTILHLSYDDCLEVRGEIIRNCSVLYCVLKLCTVIITLR